MLSIFLSPLRMTVLFVVLMLTSPAARAQTAARLAADKQIVAGEKFYSKGRFDLALPYFKKATSLDPAYDNAQLWVARVYDRWGDAAVSVHARAKACERYHAARAAYKNALRSAAPKSDRATRARRWLAELENKINQTCNDSTPVRVMLNDKLLPLSLRPLVQGREVLVPLDAVMSALGAVKTEAYDPLDNTITYQLDDRSIQVQLNVRVVMVRDKSGGIDNQRRVILDTPLIEVRSAGRDYAVIESDFFEKALGARVEWDARAHVLKLKYPNDAPADVNGVLRRFESEPAPTIIVGIGSEEHQFALSGNASIARQSAGGESTPLALSDLKPEQNLILKFNVRREVNAVIVTDAPPLIAIVPAPTPTPAPAPPPLSEIKPEKAAEVMAHAGGANALALARDGRTVATGGNDGLVKLWGLGTDMPQAGITIKENGPVHALAFSPDGRVLASAASRVVNLWDAAGGALLKKWEGHIGPVLALAFSPDGKVLAAGARDNSTLPRGQVRFWDVEAAQFRQKLDLSSACTGLAFSPFGALATLSGSYYVDVYKPSGGGFDYDKSMSFERWNRMTDVKFAPDGTSLFAANDDGLARAWNADGALSWKSETGGPLLAVTVTPDGRVLATGGANATLKLWDAHSGKPLGAWIDTANSKLVINALAAHGSHIVGAGSDGKLRVWKWR
jgi:WD40 repeat protein/tetratricopeptide (TPR) repeat protein